MNWVDIALVIIVGLSGFFGLWRGFFREVLSLGAWVAALLVARFYTPDLVPYLEGLLANEMARYVLAFAILCLSTLLLGALVNHLVNRLIRAAGLQVSDRMLGAVFGILRGVVIVAVIVFVGRSFFETELWWQESALLPYVMDLIEWSRSIFTDPATQP